MFSIWHELQSSLLPWSNSLNSVGFSSQQLSIRLHMKFLSFYFQTLPEGMNSEPHFYRYLCIVLISCTRSTGAHFALTGICCPSSFQIVLIYLGLSYNGCRKPCFQVDMDTIVLFLVTTGYFGWLWFITYREIICTCLICLAWKFMDSSFWEESTVIQFLEWHW